MERPSQQNRQVLFRHSFFGNGNHGFVDGTGLDVRRGAIAFEKGKRCAHRCAFVAVEEGLRFRDVIRVGRGDVEDVTATLEITVVRVNDGRL